MKGNKQAAIDFLQLVVKGKIDYAYKKYVNMNGKHHNVFFPSGFNSLLKAMKENHEKFPKKQLNIKNVLEDGDLVAVHSNLIFNPGDPEMITVHILRFEKNRIVEIWDCSQQIPKDSPNKNGAF